MHPKPMRETFRPSEPKATCFIADDYSERRFVHLGVVINRTGVVATVIFSAVLITASGFLAFDVFRPSPAPHALMNVEGIVALCFLAVLLARSDKTGTIDARHGFEALPAAAILIAVALAFAPILHTPFLYDDYAHITDASHATWRTIADSFGPGQHVFFRPVGFLLYWLYYPWAGANATWWHAGSIAIHTLCSVLAYALCRELGLGRPASLGGALLFAVSGVSAEAVAWVDAGFVLPPTAFVLVSLLCVCRYASTNRALWLTGALAAGACAMLSKETAYCLPFLIVTLALFRDRSDWNRIRRAAIFAGVLTAALFAYRWWALKGIGGYAGSYGNVSILHFNLIRTLDALFLRQWAVLSFPINWSWPMSPILRAALAATPLILVACAWLAKPARRRLLGSLAFIVAAALPVEHLLLLSPDLGGSRTLYLGCVGWALLWALVMDSMRPAARIVTACVLVTLQVSTLEHNLAVWGNTARLAQSVCVEFGRAIADGQEPAVVSGLPATRNGAVFLQNGFPQCMEMNTGVPASRIQEHAEPGAREFVWNEATGRIEAATSRPDQR